MSAPVRAVLFDLDGTLVDSEIHTDAAVREIAARHGVADFSLPHTETRGRTWGHIADAMRERGPIALGREALAQELLLYWDVIAADPTPVPGATDALREASRHLALGVVSSSPKPVIDRFLAKLGLSGFIAPDARIGGDAVARSQPYPEVYLLGGRALKADPADCLVFEDSRAGLEAARAAGMRSMFIRCCAADIPGNTALATASSRDYRSLPPNFWLRIREGSLDFAGQAYP
jgi:HAD superfamily hydrolase (TIGR01509 family)